MDKEIAEEILLRYKEGKASVEEIILVEKWMMYGADQGFDLTEEELLHDLNGLRQRMNFIQPKNQKIILWQRLAVAVSIILIASLGMIFYLRENRHKEFVSASPPVIVAGSNRATLTLSDGSTIQLNKSVGNISKETGIEITNDTHGNLVYKVSEQTPGLKSINDFNTISTPRGGQYKIILPDGSKVWLNAASSLRFPVSFSDNDRTVEINGEGYFEVAKSRKKFKVLTGNTTVEVLGTHFNVNAYENEFANTITLVEGSVKVKRGKASLIIKPGEQAIVNSAVAKEEILLKSNVDAESLIAWKDGQFHFNNTDLKEIMRQLERWYDVDVDRNIIPNKRFNGTISRNVKLSEVLAMIELTSNLHFKIEGRKIMMK